jgi:hypothetical protein
VTGEYCIAGKCMVATSCPPGSDLCGPTTGPAGCVNLKSDPSNCGVCGKSCEAGAFCLDGSCHAYFPAPGCAACPCAACVAAGTACCNLSGAPVCAPACP